MRVEQEQKVTEDARRFAEQDAAAQRYAAQVLQVAFSLFSHLVLLLYFVNISHKYKIIILKKIIVFQKADPDLGIVVL